MPDVLSLLTERFQQAVVAAFGDAYAKIDPLIRPSSGGASGGTSGGRGDYQANLAMSLARQVGMKPRDVAQKIVDAVKLGDVCSKIEIAGPGFINLCLAENFLNGAINAMAADERLGVPVASPAQTVVVDYSSPNVAKEMHVGHLRSTIIGDAIARVLDFQKHQVIRQNHVGDWGTQFGRVMLGLWYEAVSINRNEKAKLDRWISTLSLIPKSGPKETVLEAAVRRDAEQLILNEIVPWHRDAYATDPGGDKYFIPYIEHQFPDLNRLQELYTFATSLTDLELAGSTMVWNRRLGEIPLASLPSLIATFVQQGSKPENHQEYAAWRKCVDVSLTSCQSVYDRLGVQLTLGDVRGESQYNDQLEGVASTMVEIGLAHESQGALVLYPDGFKDAEGNPQAMIIRKSDGGFLYATTDLAAARYRIHDLRADRIIYVTDARQGDHFAMVFWALRAAKWVPEHVKLEHVPFGMVLGPDKKPFKTRTGGTVKLVDLLDEAVDRAMKVINEKNPELPEIERKTVAHAVGIGALKYADLSGDRVKDYIFDWNRMLAFDGNTAPYIQNAYVRVHGIFRKGSVNPADLRDKPIIITDVAERLLAMKLLQLPAVIDSVAQSLEPHRLCAYLYDLAASYHKFFESCPVLTAPDEATKLSRLRLGNVTAKTFKQGLGLLGIETIERM